MKQMANSERQKVGQQCRVRHWWEVPSNGYRASALQDEKSSGDWLHNSTDVLNTMDHTL